MKTTNEVADTLRAQIRFWENKILTAPEGSKVRELGEELLTRFIMELEIFDKTFEG